MADIEFENERTFKCRTAELESLKSEVKIEMLKRRNWFISKGKYENWWNCE